ncbi:MAG: ribonuclease P protein component [Thermosynechococcaceae cyanobacterium]
MLPKTNRLRHRRDFAVVYRKGIRCNVGALGLRACRNPQKPDLSPPSRVGISISTKVSKRAVVRNRIKRQLRAALRRLLPHLDNGWDAVIVVYPQAVQCDYQEFLQQLKQLLVQAEMFHGH